LVETLFVGLYEIEGVGVAEPGRIDPLSGRDVTGLHSYKLLLSHHLTDYRGRLTIDWGPGFRSWVQRASKQDKAIVEIRRRINEPQFPGFLDFRERLSGLVGVPFSWRTALSSVNGIYLLTCPDSGKQYVGLAHGAGGFWGIPASDYQVSVLEVASSSTDFETLAKMESRWKGKQRWQELRHRQRRIHYDGNSNTNEMS
jgi:hypothetical protein